MTNDTMPSTVELPDRIVIERHELLGLSASAQDEIKRVLREREPGKRRRPTRSSSRKDVVPFDLDSDLAKRLLYRLADNHKRRLELFARNDGRVGMNDLLAVTGDADVRVLSYFHGALNRKLRRIVGDRERKAFLIGWDYGSTTWDAEHKRIVDGICYVTPATAKSLRECLL